MLSVLSQYSLMESQSERPFKAYPRSPVSLSAQTYPSASLPASFYGAYPAMSSSPSCMVRPESLMSMPMSSQMTSSQTSQSLTSHIAGQHTSPNQHDLTRASYYANPSMQLNNSYMDIGYKKETDGHISPLGVAGTVGPNDIPLTVSTSADSTSKVANAVESLHKDSAISPCNDGSNSSGGEDTASIRGVPPKKRPHSQSLYDAMKDQTYWDKRKKNNESAKRSRDARRMKEEQIALRVVYLEQENLQLRTEVSLLRSEIEKLRCMLYNG